MDYRGTLCLSTVGTDASYDTAISVRNGCADPNSEVACNDDVNDARLSAQVEYFVERETEPFVLVDSLNAGGNLLFSVREGLVQIVSTTSTVPRAGAARVSAVWSVATIMTAKMDWSVPMNAACPPCDDSGLWCGYDLHREFMCAR